MNNELLALYRTLIDQTDDQLITLLKQRFELTAQIGKIKKTNNLAINNPSREEAILNRLCSGQTPEFQTLIKNLYPFIFTYAKKTEAD